MKNNGFTRRTFLKTSLAAGAGASVLLGNPLSPTLRALADEHDDEHFLSGSGQWLPTTCQGCTSWCAAQAYVVDGRVVKVRGNPNSKVNVGKACPKMHLALQQVYDPDRIKTPMKRTNAAKGRNEDPGFVPITWDEALDTVADKIMELRDAGETHKYMLMRGRYSYMRDIIYDRMTKIIGSPNNISHSSICAEAEKFGAYYTEGEWTYRQYDIKNARYILLWGADPLAANRQVSYYSSAWGEAADQATIAVVDPRLSTGAAKADEWLPIKPGYDGALAVAMAHVILTEGLWYKDFVGDFHPDSPVQAFTAGETIDEEFDLDGVMTPTFEDNHAHGLLKWWNLELKDKTAAWAADLTDLPAEQIEKVATEYAQAAPHAITWLGGGPAMQVRGAYSAIAIHALNGLVGSVDNIGGTGIANKEYTSSFPSPDDFIDAIASEGKSNSKIDWRGRLEFPALTKGKSGGGVVTNNAAAGILADDPNDIKVLVSYMANFPFSCPGTNRWEEALSKVPFSVNISTHASEIAWFADIVLPATHHMFEKWGYVKAHGNGHRHVTLNQPVADRVWDVYSDETQVPWLLAKKLEEKGFSNLMDHYKTYKDPETGKAPTNEAEFELYALKYATQNLWNTYKGGDYFEGWEDFRSAGVWNSAPYAFRERWGNMKTVTKKFEFYSETLKKALKLHAEKHETTVDDVLDVCNYQATGELAFVPHYEEPFIDGDEGEYPLVFVDYKSKLNREGRSANCSWYHELKDVDPGDVSNADVARIHPSDANGIVDGDTIKITSPTGTIECTAKLWEGNRPGTISKSYGQGHWAYGSVASKEFGVVARGGNNNDLIPAQYERLSGSTAYYGTVRVKVEKV